jgi:ribosome modulation factor
MATNSAHWNEGKSAKQAGQSDEANPYRAGSQESADWLEGYTFDEREQNVDRPEPDEG